MRSLKTNLRKPSVVAGQCNMVVFWYVWDSVYGRLRGQLDPIDFAISAGIKL